MVYDWWLEQGPRPDEQFIVVHGDARGGDTHAKRWALERRCRDSRVDEESHPADWERHRRPGRKNPAGMIRNEQMVNSGIDVCLGFPLDGLGTPRCLRLAVVAGVETYRYENGQMRRLIPGVDTKIYPYSWTCQYCGHVTRSTNRNTGRSTHHRHVKECAVAHGA